MAIDKPPFAVTETGWGEFPLNIRVQFAPETGEKSVNFVHQLRLKGGLSIALRDVN
jgi:YEATS domain-containing protein 4